MNDQQRGLHTIKAANSFWIPINMDFTSEQYMDDGILALMPGNKEDREYNVQVSYIGMPGAESEKEHNNTIM